MLTEEFSIKNLEKNIRISDEYHYPFIRVESQRKHYLNGISNRIHNNDFSFFRLVTKSIRKFRAYRNQKLGDELVLRRLTEVIKRAYKIKVSDRSSIISQVKLILAESTPKHILRLDISSFFESIDRSVILKNLKNDRLLSFTSMSLLQRFFESLDAINVKKGVPRGMSISSVLSELYLTEMDSDIKKIDGVYFYARYVDDIIIFSTKNSDDVYQKIEEILPTNILLNTEKSKRYFIGCRCSSACSHLPGKCPCSTKCKCKLISEKNLNIEYIGYNFIASDILQSNKSNPQTIDIDLAKKKLNRIKTRVIFTFLSHIKNPNFDLLKMRLKFLSENQRLRGLNSRGKLKTGIFYNYPLLTKHEALVELDQFIRKIIFSSGSSFSSKVSSSLSLSEKQQLLKLSFLSGYKNRRVIKLSSGLVVAVRRCWKNV